MLIKRYITIIIIHIIPFDEMTQYTHMAIVEHLLHSKAILHINEKVTKSYTFHYQII